MDKEHFDQLVKAVRQMNRHMAGKVVRGVKTTKLTEPDVRAIREAAKISQSQFARLIGVICARCKTGNSAVHGHPVRHVCC